MTAARGRVEGALRGAGTLLLRPVPWRNKMHERVHERCNALQRRRSAQDEAAGEEG